MLRINPPSIMQILKAAVVAGGLMLAAPAGAQMLTPHEPLDPSKAQSLEFVPLSIESGGKRYDFMVEVADTDRKRMTGLMHRNHLADDRGMLFDFKESRVIHIWMRNTFIPIDLLFIRKDGTVGYTVEHMVPHSEESVGPNAKMYSVLEVSDGTVARLGIKPGDVVHRPVFGNALPAAASQKK